MQCRDSVMDDTRKLTLSDQKHRKYVTCVVIWSLVLNKLVQTYFDFVAKT